MTNVYVRARGATHKASILARLPVSPAVEIVSFTISTVSKSTHFVNMRVAFALALLLAAALCAEAAYKPSQSTHISEEVRDSLRNLSRMMHRCRVVRLCLGTTVARAYASWILNALQLSPLPGQRVCTLITWY